MQFTTQVPVHKGSKPIGYSSRIVSLGSCFAENIAEKLKYFQFREAVNPFGILFHPVAIENFIRFAVDGKTFSANDIFLFNERWHCFDAHSDLSQDNNQQMTETLNAIVKSFRQDLTSATHFIITYGTAWVYKEKSSNSIVASCHKLPQGRFEKLLLSPAEVSSAILNAIELIRKINMRAEIIFTVSPVRHLKDGFAENQLSKANLISGLHRAISESGLAVSYFPSYEVMMDELRDYRFYANDMIHPNSTAIDYIFERFMDAWIDPNELPVMKTVCDIRKALAHKPFHADSESHRSFIAGIDEKISKLQADYPHFIF